MAWNGWPRLRIRLPGREGGAGGREVEAIAPLIISASRSTDIPAFYGDWFMERLRRGYAAWINPWNGIPVYVSFGNARVFAFWSKNPEPFLPHLAEVSRLGFAYHVLFTLNDYESEGLEPRVPPLDERIRTFITLSKMVGKGRVLWRWDPLLLSGTLDVDRLLDRIQAVGDAVAPFTRRLVISFIDIARYPKVARNLRNRGYGDVREFTHAEEDEFAAGLHGLNRSWDLRISACGEERDLSRFGIEPGQCISYDLLLREFGQDPALAGFLGHPDLSFHGAEGAPIPVPERLKDPGQRRACGCVVSKDIGEYATCPHLCVYCYANTSPDAVRRRYEASRRLAGQGIFPDSISGGRAPASLHTGKERGKSISRSSGDHSSSSG